MWYGSLPVCKSLATFQVFLPAMAAHTNPRSISAVDTFRASLMTYHDQLADLKSYFDGRGSDSFDEGSFCCIKKSMTISHKFWFCFDDQPRLWEWISGSALGKWRHWTTWSKRLKLSHCLSWELYPSPTKFSMGLHFHKLPNSSSRASRAMMEDTKLRKSGAHHFFKAKLSNQPFAI